MKSYNTENLKLTKRIITLFVIVAMVLTTVLPAFASDDNVVSVSSITFDDGSGNIVQSLDGLDRVRAQVTVKTKSSQKMIFVLALYGKNNKLLKIDREEKRATSQGTTFEAIIEYDLPDNAEGYKLNAFLLDSVKSMNAIARGSLFPSGNLELSNLYVTIDDNEPVDLLKVEASKDGIYEIDVPLDIKYAPSVKAVAVDNGTKAEVTPPTFFPGYTDIKLTATNGATKNYRINYSAQSTMESLSGYLGTDFHAADDTEDSYGSPYYNDRSTPATNSDGIAYYNDIRTISDEWDYLKGSNYYKAAVGDYPNPSYKSDRSTTVRVFGTSAITGDGWTSATNAEGHITVSHTSGAGVEGHEQYQAPQRMTVASSKTFPAGTVTLPAIPKNFVVVVEPAQYVPESHRAFLVNSIEVNGNAVDTSEGPGTYNVPLASDIIYTPEIAEEDVAFAEEYDNRTVEITNPTSFPGQSVIKITSGEESVEYVINYSLDNLLTNASNNIGTNFHAADDANAVESGGHLRGSRFFMDRDDTTLWVGNNPANGVAYYNDIRSICSEYDFLNGSTYFMSSAAAPVNTKFTVGRAADVYAFTIGTGSISGTAGWDFSENANGFVTISSTSGQGVGTAAAGKLTKLYHKTLSVGDSVNVTPSNREAIVVVKFKGYIEKGVTLTDLKIDGETIAGFSSDRTDYTVELSADTLICPEVTAEADDPDTEIEIIEPTSFPGKTTVKLTYGDKTKEFTITYTTGDLITNASRAIGKDFHAADDANATEVNGAKIGSTLYNDRSSPSFNSVTGEFAYFNDIRAISDEWDYLNGTDFFTSAVGARNVTFTLNRNATVRVFSQGTAAMNTADGWTRETKSAGYMVASTTTGQLTVENSAKFTEMFCKSFKAGDTVTVNPTVKESIIVIDYIGYIEAGAMLTDLAVDGETVADFDMTKNDYTVEIDADTLIAPEVSATAMIDGADVEITNPTTFPGKATIKVTYGDDENVYTITYTSGELISNASRAVGKNFHAAEGDGVGSQLFSDRNTPAYVGNNAANGIAYYNDIRAISDDWNYLTGTDYFMSAVAADLRPVTFTLNRAATVRVFSDGTVAMNTADGWTREGKTDGYYLVASTTSGHLTTENSNKFTQMFYKQFNAGDQVTVSPTTMTAVTVIDYVGYVDGVAVLSDISIDGQTLTDFGMNKTEYNVEIAPDTVVLPEVTATALNPDSEVEIINPGEGDNPNVFPGKVIINVSESGVENQYIINYTCEGLTAITDMSSSNGGSFFGTNFHEPGDFGETYGSRLYYDRTAVPAASGSTINYYNDIREIADELDYLKGTDYIMANRNLGSNVNHTFTLLRPATIRAFYNTGDASVNETLAGWTTETNADGYLKISHTLGAGVEGHANYTELKKLNAMTYKKFGAGDVVSINSPGQYSLVVIDYAGYGEQAEEVEEIAALTDISIDGVSIAGFDMDTTDYAYEIAPDTVVAPEITATALVEGSEIEIINPGEGDNPNVFPGKSIVIVRIGDDEREYTIDYTYTALSAITDMSSSNGGSFFAANFHEPGDFGETYGSKLFYDRSSPMASGSTINYYNDIREIADDFDYLKGTDYIMANRNQGANITHTFTLLRPATIRVFHLTGYASGNASIADWTTETRESGFAKLSHTLGAGVEGHANYTAPMQLGSMTYKEFEAGEEVSVASPGDQAIVVIDYAGYEIN